MACLLLLLSFYFVLHMASCQSCGDSCPHPPSVFGGCVAPSDPVSAYFDTGSDSCGRAEFFFFGFDYDVSSGLYTPGPVRFVSSARDQAFKVWNEFLEYSPRGFQGTPGGYFNNTEPATGRRNVDGRWVYERTFDPPNWGEVPLVSCLPFADYYRRMRFPGMDVTVAYDSNGPIAIRAGNEGPCPVETCSYEGFDYCPAQSEVSFPYFRERGISAFVRDFQRIVGRDHPLKTDTCNLPFTPNSCGLCVGSNSDLIPQDCDKCRLVRAEKFFNPGFHSVHGCLLHHFCNGTANDIDCPSQVCIRYRCNDYRRCDLVNHGNELSSCYFHPETHSSLSSPNAFFDNYYHTMYQIWGQQGSFYDDRAMVIVQHIANNGCFLNFEGYCDWAVMTRYGQDIQNEGTLYVPQTRQCNALLSFEPYEERDFVYRSDG